MKNQMNTVKSTVSQVKLQTLVKVKKISNKALRK